MPLPPYIAARRPPDERDRADYQTMFARADGSVAAPTAGLHFTDALVARLRERGVALHTVTLHVGPGTFLPVKADDTAEHRMHAEYGSVSAATAAALNAVAPRRRPHRRGRLDLAAAAGKRERRGRHHSAFHRRDRAVHHAGLPLPRRRRDDDQFPSAALDPVHAGRGVLPGST